MLSSNKTVSAAVKPDNAVTWESVNNYQYYQTSFTTNSSWGRTLKLTDMSTSIKTTTAGISSFDEDTALATASKITTDKRVYVVNYVVFKAKITVPAYTGYTVKFSEKMNINSIGGGSAHSWADLYVFGDTDKSSAITFGYFNSGNAATGYATPTGVTRINNHVKATSTGSGTSYNVAEACTKTYTNNDNKATDYYAYFGFYTGTSAGDSNAYRFYSTVKMTTAITVTAISAPKVNGGDTASANYNANGNTFTISNYDSNRMDKTVSYTPAGGTATDVTDSTIISADGSCKLTDVGTYTFTFNIKDNCGAVWNSTSNDQSPKTLTITINPITVTAPTISNKSLVYDKNGCNFTVTGYDSATTDAVKVTDEGISWNGTGFKATAKGDYVVKFVLKDKVNYVWSTGGSDDIEVNLEVTAKPVEVKWTSQKTEITDADPSFFVMLPSLNVTAEVKTLLSEVKYYLEENCTVSGTNITTTGEPVSQIEKDKSYYAVVEINTEVAKDNYTFSGNLYSAFNTLDERTVVIVTLEDDEDNCYDGNLKPATAKVVTADGEDISDQIDLLYTYYEEGSETPMLGAPTDAGKYKVVVSLKPADRENYTTSDSLEFEYIVYQAEPTVNPHYTGTLFVGGDLPELKAGATDTAGTYAWDNPDQKLGSGTRTYGYTFTPTDTKNYKTVQKTIDLSAAEAGIKSITAEFNFPEDLVIYDSMKPDDLRQYLTVTGTKEDGTIQENLTGYTFTQTKLTAGDNVTLTVNYGTVAPVNVTIPKVVKCELAEITAVFSPEETIYTSTDIDELKQWLTITGKNNDGSNYTGTISGTDCTLKFGEDDKLTAGTITIDVEYKGIKTTFNVTVEEVALESIKADWLKTVEVDEITGKTPEDELRKLIKVVGTNNDGSSYGEITEYTLKKTVKGTTLTVTITYEGLTTQLTKEVEEEPEITEKTPLPIPDFTNAPAYTGNDIDILSAIGWKHTNYVNISGDRTGKFADDYSITLTIKDKYLDAYEWAEGESNTITLPWKIEKAELKVKWNSRGKLDPDGGNYDGSIEGLFTYKYTDENGEEVTELEEGKTYKVTAELVDKNNFAMSDEMSFDISTPFEFTAKSAEVDDGGFMKVLKDNLGIIIGVALGLLLLLALLLFFLLRRRRADDYDDYYDDEYYDDEDDEDEDEDEEEDDYDYDE